MEPPSIRHKSEMIGLWNRFVRISDQRLIKKIFNWDISHGHAWAHEMKSLLHSNDLEIRRKMFCLIKNCYDVESYVKYNLNKGQISLCAQLRTGRLPLATETGRFNATPEEERLLLCELGELENEVHFLFYCPTYEDLRDVLFTKMSSVYVDFFDG